MVYIISCETYLCLYKYFTCFLLSQTLKPHCTKNTFYVLQDRLFLNICYYLYFSTLTHYYLPLNCLVSTLYKASCIPACSLYTLTCTSTSSSTWNTHNKSFLGAIHFVSKTANLNTSAQQLTFEY